ncbi:carboxypeptidase regulatory-like domain-containing protein [Rhodoflexus sp.]
MNHALRYCLFLLLNLSAVLQAHAGSLVQDSTLLPEFFGIKGIIADSLSQRPIAAAWIFVNQTSLDTISLRNGRYQLSRIPMGAHEIIVTAAGYAPRRLLACGTSQLPLPDTIRLLPIQPTPVNELMARTSDKRWQLFYQRFKEHFIGTSPFAGEVKVLNPWVLYFEETSKNEWRALTDELLIVENMALGYRLKCYIEQLAVAGKISVFDGGIFYEPIKTLDNRIADRWKANRQFAYRGSLMEFLRRLTVTDSDSLYKAFRLRGTENFYHTAIPAPQFATTFQAIKKVETPPYEFRLYFNRDHLQINYMGLGEDMAYRRFVNRITKIQRMPEKFRASWLASRSEEVVFNRLGYFNNALEVELYGYWEYLRLADRLPITYFP